MEIEEEFSSVKSEQGEQHGLTCRVPHIALGTHESAEGGMINIS